MHQHLKQFEEIILKAYDWIQKLWERKKRKFDSDWYSVFKKLAVEFITLFEFTNKIKKIKLQFKFKNYFRM